MPYSHTISHRTVERPSIIPLPSRTALNNGSYDFLFNARTASVRPHEDDDEEAIYEYDIVCARTPSFLREQICRSGEGNSRRATALGTGTYDRWSVLNDDDDFTFYDTSLPRPRNRTLSYIRPNVPVLMHRATPSSDGRSGLFTTLNPNMDGGDESFRPYNDRHFRQPFIIVDPSAADPTP